MIPKRIRKENNTYKLIKEYKKFVLYQNEKTRVKECISKFDLGLIHEVVKPGRNARKGGAVKI